MACDNWDELGLDDFDNSDEKFGVLQFVAIKPLYELLPSMQSDLIGERQRSQPFKRERIKFE